MREREKVLSVVREWVLKAENDFKTAVHTLKLAQQCPTDTVCFHAQQCVEKYVKAMLVLKRIDFPKTQDLEKLGALLPARVRGMLTTKEQQRLTDYATGARYPGGGEIALLEARQAVAIARRVRSEMRNVLPKEALLPRRK